MSTVRTLSPANADQQVIRRRLAALAISGPLWAVVSLTQAAMRDGFDLTRHPLSMLSTGSLGWLQITNFVVAGLLAVIGASGLRQVVPGRAIPVLVAIYGVGYVLCGVFSLDPGDGFPAGTPAGASASFSWHAVAHLLAGMVAFLALTVVLAMFAVVFRRRGERGWAVGSAVAAVAVVGANVATGLGVPGPSLVLAVGVLTGMLWLSAITAKLRRTAA